MTQSEYTPKLPHPRPGRVWGIRIYPGGRTEYRQYRPGRIMNRRIAEYLLAENSCVDVSIDDAIWLLRQRKEASHDTD